MEGRAKSPTKSPHKSPSIRQRKRKVFKSENVNRIFKNMLKKNINFDYDTERKINDDGINYIIKEEVTKKFS
jgi:hypothetical protein